MPTRSARASSASARLENGFQIYETTDKADVNVDYLPTGNMFLPPETRQALIELAVAEAGLGDKVEVAFYREIYDTKGFQGVIAEIKRRHPGVRLHCLHGTDYGGMCVRQDLRRVRLDLSVAHPAPRRRLGDGDPERREGHDVGGGDRRARATDRKSSGRDGWGPALSERQRSTDRGGLA